MPQREHNLARFGINHIDINKNENTYLLAITVREHLEKSYQFKLKIYTDGSVLDSLDCGAGFVIPDLKINKSYYLGKGLSIFTAELYAILMALHFINDSPLTFYGIVFCVDSKSVLHSISNWDCKLRCDFLFEIRYLIHCIVSKGIVVDFCWVPSHCGINWNNVADILAKKEAKQSSDSMKTNNIDLSCHELFSLLEKSFVKEKDKKYVNIIQYPRYLSIVIVRLRCDALKTKFVKNISCICSEQLSVQHIILTVLF